jgi:hypothetical protein
MQSSTGAPGVIQPTENACWHLYARCRSPETCTPFSTYYTSTSNSNYTPWGNPIHVHCNVRFAAAVWGKACAYRDGHSVPGREMRARLRCVDRFVERTYCTMLRSYRTCCRVLLLIVISLSSSSHVGVYSVCSVCAGGSGQAALPDSLPRHPSHSRFTANSDTASAVCCRTPGAVQKQHRHCCRRAMDDMDMAMQMTFSR